MRESVAENWQTWLLCRGGRQRRSRIVHWRRLWRLCCHLICWVAVRLSLQRANSRFYLTVNVGKRKTGSFHTCIFTPELSNPLSDELTIALLLATALTFALVVLSWPAPPRACARATACAANPCLAPTSCTGMWGVLCPPEAAWVLLGGAGRMGVGCRGGICAGKRWPWAVLGWIGTGPLSAAVLACCNGCTTRVCVLMLAFVVTGPIEYPWVVVGTFEVGTRITGAAEEDRRSWERGSAGEEVEEGATEAAGVTLMGAWLPVFTAMVLPVDCWLKLALATCCCCRCGCACCCWDVWLKVCCCCCCCRCCCCCWPRGKLAASFLSGNSDFTATARGPQCKARFWTCQGKKTGEVCVV